MQSGTPGRETSPAAVSTDGPSSAVKPRAWLLDWLQWPAVFAIVSAHVQGDQRSRILSAGLPLFLICTFVFCSRINARPLGQVIATRWRRLMVPWLFWSLVYAVAFALHFWPDTSAIVAQYDRFTLLSGTSSHLWYLPYAFVLGVVAFVLQRWLRPLPAAVQVAVLLLAFVACLAFDQWLGDLDEPCFQWVSSLASVPLGMLLAGLYGRGLLARRPAVTITLSMIVSLAGLALLYGIDGWAHHLPRYMIAGGLVAAALSLPMRSPSPRTMELHHLIFGIYLTHMLVMIVLWQIRPYCPVHIPRLPFIWLTMIGAGALTYGLRKTPLRRFV